MLFFLAPGCAEGEIGLAGDRNDRQIPVLPGDDPLSNNMMGIVSLEIVEYDG